jgi:hypothetical protein
MPKNITRTARCRRAGLSEYIPNKNRRKTMIESMDRIDLENPRITLVRHDTPESIFNEFWNFEKDLTWAELLEQEMEGVTADGDEVKATLADAFEGIKAMDFWGFSNSITNDVHIWTSDSLKIDDLRILIGHEIGHLLEELPLSDDPDIADEQRADNYGKCAVLTERFLQRIIYTKG